MYDKNGNFNYYTAEMYAGFFLRKIQYAMKIIL